MKYTIAIVLVVVSMVSAEIPRQSHLLLPTNGGAARVPSTSLTSSRQSAPYIARGWRPTGRPFNLPLKSTPDPLIGADKEGEAISTTTTEETVSSTEEVTDRAALPQQITKPEKLTENLEPDSEKISAAPQLMVQPQPQVRIQLQRQLLQPQQQQFQPIQMVYVVPPQPQNRNFAYPSQQLVATNLQQVQVQQQPAVSSSVFTPFSTSFVQIYQ